ncbi:hypothetical protein, partial [Streptomyces sp. NBC_01485]|uniref:hypothetical protein n=1 Tax=Streptomyces sp. NBC_01485 TaxID=2903884 RepID=UPI002E31EF71
MTRSDCVTPKEAAPLRGAGGSAPGWQSPAVTALWSRLVRGLRAGSSYCRPFCGFLAPFSVAFPLVRELIGR